MNHKIKILSAGECPAVGCSCGKWGHTFTRKPGDTIQSLIATLEQAHAEHVASTEEKG